ncbi:MAG: magnesium-translocating P-type ATPase [Candidatus Altiarchaeota archaeon]|nr:magnesium-translocating P-type ATPase [Candidatus Altiarchaeota archaeon]
MPFTEKTLAYFASREADDVAAELKTSANGLSEREAKRRIAAYGPNVISERKRLNVIFEFLSHFKSPLVIILLIAAGVSAFLGEFADAIIIAVMVLLGVILDFFLEYNAGKASEKLKQIVRTKVTVSRDGARKEVFHSDICEGDVLFLSAGSMVPADARIISAKDFFVNQSSLTGESFPSEKTAAKLHEAEHSVSEMHNIVFLGTNVISGSATAIVLKTGSHTEFGKIASKLSSPSEETDFDRGINDFGHLVMKATFFLVLLIFLFNAMMKRDLIDSFLFALAVAVGLTPELLPMIMSVTMAKGSLGMAKEGVIVKRLASIPNFGSMDVLCTDKTGTLTQDKIQLVKYTDAVGRHSESVLLHVYLNSSYQTGIKNPLDTAVLEFKAMDISAYEKVDEIPFDFVRKKMSVVAGRSGKRILITKGAPEEVFKSCETYEHDGKPMPLTHEAKEKVREQYHSLSMDGYRVLAVAVREVPEAKSYSKHDEKDMKLLGFVSFLDPPKSDVKEVLQELHHAGVEIKIITGDNELVTKKICDDISLPIKGILLGAEIDHLTDDALRVRAEKTTIFARFSPDEKNRVINALRANGHVVGYMGDGINDAPSLKAADIGISVSSAVDVARESADIILTRKSLRVLRHGILEGRKTFGNTLKYIMMGLSSNFGNMFSVLGAVVYLPFLPMLPVQILLNNFIYDFSQITIPTDNVDKEFIQKPKRWDMKFIRKFMIVFGPVSSVFDIISFIVLYGIFGLSQAAFQTGWFMESLATQTLVIHVIRTKKIPFIQSNASRSLLASSILCVALGWLLPYTPLAKYFGFAPLSLPILAALAGIVLVYLVCVEITKRIFYARNDL